MKYNAPYGSADPNASYVDRNTAGAVKGSVPPGAAIEDPQREIMAVITHALGGSGSAEDKTQLLQAILAMIAAATGGGDTSNFVLMTQARARLPIFPQVLTADGKLPVSSPGVGVVRVPAGYDFLHRGIYGLTTVQTDFNTVANKTYHLRWNPTDGFALKDLADAGYNPSALAEADPAFDSRYDDMLVAKVVTSAGNVATITSLVNQNDIFDLYHVEGAPTLVSSNSGYQYSATRTLNWARTPKNASVVGSIAVQVVTQGYMQGTAAYVTTDSRTRYGVAARIFADWDINFIGSGMVGQLDFNCAA